MTSHFYKIILPNWIFFLVGVYFLATSFALIKVFYIIAGFYLIGIIGNTIGFHRYLTHQSFQTTKFWHIFFLILGSCSGQGSPIFYQAIHLHHHRHSDTDLDPHSPLKGFWESFLGWQIFKKTVNYKLYFPKVLLSDKLAKSIHVYYYKIYWTIGCIIALIDFEFALYFYFIGGFFILSIIENLSNFLFHNTNYGYVNFDTNDNSRNIPWIAYLTLGAGWHNNHHHDPKNYKFGVKKFEVDLSSYLIDWIKIK